ncbi:serine/threonine-protein phosphatase [Candidatus Poribacteria bacterium]|nr:serine/threonine-protein phosphatase [Candidatus Poribacteria bacterium]
MESHWQIRVSGKRHRGQKKKQQDSFFIGLTPSKKGENNDFLLVIADGMSAPGHGDIVSQIATETAEEIFETWALRRNPNPDNRDFGPEENFPQHLFEEIYLNTYDRIRAKIEREPSLEGMGTTLTMAYLHEDVVYYFHVGDSRIYHIRGSGGHFPYNIRQITVDHVPPNRMRNELTQAIGIDFIVPKQRATNHSGIIITPDTGQFRLSPNDRLVLCSDGLYKVLDENVIQQIVTTSDIPETACAELIEQAQSSRDNISVIVLQAFQEEARRDIYDIIPDSFALCSSMPPREVALMRPTQTTAFTQVKQSSETTCEIIRRLHFTIEHKDNPLTPFSPLIKGTRGLFKGEGGTIDFVQTTGELMPLESSSYHLSETLFPFTSSPYHLKLSFENLPPILQIAIKKQMPSVEVTSLNQLRIERVALSMSINQKAEEWIKKLPQHEITIPQMQKELTSLRKEDNKLDAVYLFIHENWRIYFPLDNPQKQNSRSDFTHKKGLKATVNFFRKRNFTILND